MESYDERLAPKVVESEKSHDLLSVSWRPRTAGGVALSKSKGREPGGQWCESQSIEGEMRRLSSTSPAGKRDGLLDAGLSGCNVGGPTLGRQFALLNPPIKC